jgi:iron complex transport system permease protein
LKPRPFILALVLFALAALVLGLLVGAAGVGLPDLNSTTGHAIFWLRLNRVLAAFVVGAALAGAGVVMQTLLRNPLAEPYVLGVSSGAGLGAAAAILTGVSASGLFALPAAAFCSAVGALGLVYALASSGGAPSVYGLLLSGAIISAIGSNLLMLLITLAPIEGLHSITWWLLGNLQVTSRAELGVAAGVTLLSLAALWLGARDLNALTLGREAAHHLGFRPARVVTLGLALATLMTATAVSLAGLIGFVGLVVPHVVRTLTGPDHRRLLPASALAGGAFLALCDTVGRVVLAPMEIPVGVVTALAGGPFFLFLLRKRRRQGWVE